MPLIIDLLQENRVISSHSLGTTHTSPDFLTDRVAELHFWDLSASMTIARLRPGFHACVTYFDQNEQLVDQFTIKGEIQFSNQPSGLGYRREIEIQDNHFPPELPVARLKFQK